MYLADRFARMLVGCDKDYLGIRVRQKDPKQLRAAIPGAAENADSDPLTGHY